MSIFFVVILQYWRSSLSFSLSIVASPYTNVKKTMNPRNVNSRLPFLWASIKAKADSRIISERDAFYCSWLFGKLSWMSIFHCACAPSGIGRNRLAERKSTRTFQKSHSICHTIARINIILSIILFVCVQCDSSSNGNANEIQEKNAEKYPSDKTETSKFGYYYQGNQYRRSNNGCVHSATYALNWFDSSCFHPSDATLHDVSVQCGLQITNDPIRLFFSGWPEGALCISNGKSYCFFSRFFIVDEYLYIVYIE